MHTCPRPIEWRRGNFFEEKIPSQSVLNLDRSSNYNLSKQGSIYSSMVPSARPQYL